MLCLLTAAALLVAADETVTVKAGELSYQAPATWKSGRPSSSMRLAQAKIPAAEGDKEEAELVVFAFKGGGGGVEPNVERWRTQFLNEDGEPAKAKTEDRKGKNVDVTFVEITGRYVAPLRPGEPETVNKPEFRLLGAIVLTDETGYFFKLTGPDKTVAAQKEAFDKLISSMSKAE
jgi:hypothetical protein